MKVLLVLGMFSIAACGNVEIRSSLTGEPEHMAPAEDWKSVVTIAVFPPDNWTYDIGPEYMTWYRAVIHEILRRKGWRVVPLGEINRFLLKNKFTMAGEIRIYSVQELAKEFRADALLFWDIVQTGMDLIQLNFHLLRADQIRLWSSGIVRLDHPYEIISKSRTSSDHRWFSIALGEILRFLPNKS